jgi:hypothetical protein
MPGKFGGVGEGTGLRAVSVELRQLVTLRQVRKARHTRIASTRPFDGAPTGTRTQTVRILSPLPLPIGLWGRRSQEA